MKTLQDCKDEIAKEQGFPNWNDYMIDHKMFDLVAERYADQFREPSSPSLQSEPVEQQKTAEQILRKHVELGSIKRGDGPIPDEEWADVDDDMKAIATNAMEEYAALRSEQLRKEIERLKGSVEMLDATVKNRDKHIFKRDARIKELEEALRTIRKAFDTTTRTSLLLERIDSIVDEALTPESTV